MNSWVDSGRRHQTPSLIAKSKGAARGRMEMFDHRLKAYRNADPGAFSPFPPLPSFFCLIALSMSFWVLPILAWYPLVAHGTAITSASDQSAARPRPRTETFNRSQTNRQSTNRHVLLNLPPRYNNHKITSRQTREASTIRSGSKRSTSNLLRHIRTTVQIGPTRSCRHQSPRVPLFKLFDIK